MSDYTSLVSSGLARGAYRASQSLAGERGEVTPAQETGESSFSALVREASANAVGAAREADAVIQSGLTGQADTQKVVEAAIELESTVRLAVSMRDKFVEAYQEILRMPI